MKVKDPEFRTTCPICTSTSLKYHCSGTSAASEACTWAACTEKQCGAILDGATKRGFARVRETLVNLVHAPGAGWIIKPPTVR